MSQINKTFSSEQYLVDYSVESQHHELRLDQFMMQFLGTLSREFIKKKIRRKEITISGRTALHKASTKVRKGETVTMVTQSRGMEAPELWVDGPLEVTGKPILVYEDEKILVVEKPPFMATHPTGRHLFNCVTVHYESLLKKPVHSVHRLDRETSGLLVLGKNPSGASEMTEKFEKGLVQKCYFLISHKKGPLTRGQGFSHFPFSAKERLSKPDATAKLQKNSTRIQVEVYPQHSLSGKEAHTDFDLIYEDKNYLFLLAFPRTGRQHQIRAHAAHHGLPLLGDKLYNGDPTVFMRFKDQIPTAEDFQLMGHPRHALHALALRFPHEEVNKTFLTRIPPDLRTWIKARLGLTMGEMDHLDRVAREKILAYFSENPAKRDN